MTMKPHELQALVVDWQMGELRPEVIALLEAYLDQNPDARKEVGQIEETLRLTRKAVQQHPELVPSPGTELKADEPTGTGGSRRLLRGGLVPAWFKAAAVLALAGLVGLGGYKLGTSRNLVGGVVMATLPPETPASAPVADASSTGGPWAKYQLARHDERRGFQVFRVERAQGERGAVQ